MTAGDGPMNGDFDACRAWVRPEEGLRSNDPEDPGGKTYEGITQAEYDAWMKLHGQLPADVFKASDATITTIYRAQYWLPYCPELPPGVALVFFDTSINQGQGIAVTFLQRSLQITADGHFGVVTAAEAQAINKPDGVTSKVVIDSMTAQRIHRYRGTRNFARFGKGWLQRAADCQDEAYKMAGITA